LFFFQFPPSDESYQTLQDRVNESGALLNLAASDLVQASRGSPNELAVSSQKYSKSFEDLMNPGMQLAGQTTVRLMIQFYPILIDHMFVGL
jgi:talin